MLSPVATGTRRKKGKRQMQSKEKQSELSVMVQCPLGLPLHVTRSDPVRDSSHCEVWPTCAPEAAFSVHHGKRLHRIARYSFTIYNIVSTIPLILNQLLVHVYCTQRYCVSQHIMYCTTGELFLCTTPAVLCLLYILLLCLTHMDMFIVHTAVMY